MSPSAYCIDEKNREPGGPHPELGWLRQEAHEFEARLGYTERYLLNQLPLRLSGCLKIIIV